MDELVTTPAEESGDLSSITDWSDLPTWGEDEDAEAGEVAESTEADQLTDGMQPDTEDTAEPEAEPTTEVAAETEKQPDTDQFTLKYLGSEVAKNKDEVIALAQKGMDYDRIHEKYEELKPLKDEIATLRAEKEKVEDAISFLDELAKGQGVSRDELIDRTQAAIIADRDKIDVSLALEKVRIDRDKRAVAKEKAAMEAAKSAKNAEVDADTKAKAKREADVKEFVEAYPTVDPKTIPKDVWEDVKQGKSLLAAYVKHENAELKARLEAEKQKAETEKKNKENKSKSTGSKSTAGNTKSGDPWLADLESRF